MIPLPVCKLHPKYKAIHPNRSQKPGCTCYQVWLAKKLREQDEAGVVEPAYIGPVVERNK